MTSFAEKSSKPANDRGFVSPGLFLVFLLIGLPMAWVVGYSLLYSFGGIGALSTGWTLSHWSRGLTTGGLTPSLLLSMGIATTVAALSTAIALAMVLQAPELGRNRLALVLFCVPLSVPVSVTAFVTLQLLSGGGLLSRLAYHAGWISSPSQFPELVHDASCVGIIVAQLVSAVPLMTLYFSQLWTTTRADRYCQLAESLGATRHRARWRIAMPLLLRRGRSLILLVFLWTLGSFEIPLILGRQAPQMFSVMAARRAGVFDLNQRPQIFVLATLYFVVVGSLLIVLLNGRPRND